MGKENGRSPAHRVIREDSPESIGLEGFTAEPDDQGLSLEELGDAYAALLGTGADPYPEVTSDVVTSARTEASDSPEIATAANVPAGAPAGLPQVIRGEDDDDCQIAPKTILEAILFVGHPHGEPLTSQQISSLMRGVIPSEVDELIGELNASYGSTGAVYRINSVGAGYRLQLREDFAPLRDKFLGRVKEARLSQAAIDILAIIAYKQPIDGGEIDRLRNKPSAALLAQLVRRDLLQIERSANKGKKPAYRTTSRFLDLFGLDSLADLPRSPDGDRGL